MIVTEARRRFTDAHVAQNGLTARPSAFHPNSPTPKPKRNQPKQDCTYRTADICNLVRNMPEFCIEISLRV